jgi:hypothetical protein
MTVGLPLPFSALDYAEMDIAGGEEASRQYKHFVEGKIADKDIEKLWADLRKYCALDTLAMLKLIGVLERYRHGA